MGYERPKLCPIILLEIQGGSASIIAIVFSIAFAVLIAIILSFDVILILCSPVKKTRNVRLNLINSITMH